MKNETKKLVKLIKEIAENRAMSVDNTLTQLVEMSYQFAVTGTYSRTYSFMQYEHNDFMACLMNAMKKLPYFDYFAEIMVELGNFDQKFKAQFMTPPEVVSAIHRMLGKSDKENVKIGEPTCGTGSFVLELVKDHIARDNKNNTLELLINEIDNRLIKITLVQCLYNLLVNNADEMETIHIRAFNNDLITEYKKNGHIVYDNDKNMIQDPYVMRYMKHKREEAAIYEMHKNMAKILSAKTKNVDKTDQTA